MEILGLPMYQYFQLNLTCLTLHSVARNNFEHCLCIFGIFPLGEKIYQFTLENTGLGLLRGNSITTSSLKKKIPLRNTDKRYEAQSSGMHCLEVVLRINA